MGECPKRVSCDADALASIMTRAGDAARPFIYFGRTCVTGTSRPVYFALFTFFPHRPYCPRGFLSLDLVARCPSGSVSPPSWSPEGPASRARALLRHPLFTSFPLGDVNCPGRGRIRHGLAPRTLRFCLALFSFHGGRPVLGAAFAEGLLSPRA